MAAPAQSGTSKRSRISARLVKFSLFCMPDCLVGGGENAEESEFEAESL